MSEPNLDIEKKLKRYAEQRRNDAGGEFELHPATRNLLQGEVARTFAAEKARRTGFLANLLWPRLAVVAVFTAILAVTIIVLNTPPKHPVTLAQNQKQESAPTANRAISRETVSGEAKRLESAAAPTEMAAPRTEVKPVVPATTTRSQSMGGAIALQDKISPKKEAFYARQQSDHSAQIEAREPRPDVAAKSVIAPEKKRVFLQENLRAKYRRNLLSPAQPDVLQSFEWIRNGNEIRLLDSDGSVYDGEILAPQIRVSGTVQTTASSEFAFRVGGTNQRLNSVLTFTGKFSETNAAKRPGLITGNVSIGGTNEFPIRAIERSE